MSRVSRALLLALALLLPRALAAQEVTAVIGPAEAPRRLLLRSTTDLGAIAPVLRLFQEAHPGLRVVYEQWGSNDLYALAAQACAGEAEPADLVISSAVQQMVALVNQGCAAPHASPATAALPAALRWRDELWGITREPVVMVYNRDLVPPEQVPRSRFDLLDLLRPQDSRYRGRVATYDIEASGLGYLLAFADSLEATTFGGLMESFGSSGAVATCCSAEIIDAVAAGQFLVAYNVLGSYALARAEADPRLGVIAPQDYTLVLSRAAMIPRAARSRGLAGEMVDFLLSPEGRAALERALLLVPMSGGEDGVLDLPGGAESLQRPIALSPALLIALDRHKRRLFNDRWRAAFPEAGGGPAQR